MPKPTRSAGLALFMSLSLAYAATPEWVTRSNVLAGPVLHDRGLFSPESASFDGQDEFDTAIADLAPQGYERLVANLESRRNALRELRSVETDIKVQQDLDILIASRERELATARLEHQYLINYVNAPEIMFWGLKGLLDGQNKPQRRARALVRLKRYAGLEAGYKPLVDLARARTEEELARPGLIGPYTEELKQALDNNAYYMKGLTELFRKSGLKGWETDLAALGQQIQTYTDWTRTTVLPRARTEIRLPAAIYADRLKQVGVEIGPDELIERAGFDFQEVRDQMQVLAKQIAARRKLPSSDYRDVSRALKKEQVSPQAMLPLYWKRLKEIEAIIRREKLITLPTRAAAIRAATDAEAAQTPSPQMQAPRLIGNTGEYGEFLIPLRNPHAKSGAVMDDFSYDAASWTLAAHEARPGHELQFAAMVEKGVSLPRAIFAWNSANVEGWALYCEAMMLPYMPPEGQLISLQDRLLRISRAFLDPMLNLGRITPADAKRFLMEEVVQSEPSAQQEIDRYAFRSPGQTTAYYYGYVQLRSLRTQTELALGKQFNQMAFNDFIMAQGLLPPALLKQAVMNEFVPAQLAKTQLAKNNTNTKQ